MAVSVQARGARHQLRVTHRLLGRPFFFTFDSEAEARTYGEQLVALLDRGIVPAELLARAPRGADDPLLVEVIRGYTREAPITDSDDALLGWLLPELVGLRVSGLTYAWAEGWVRRLKMERRLAPGTIRKRVGALARVVDWHLRHVAAHGQAPAANALRLLPRGYSVYTRGEAEALRAHGHEPKRDVARDRRLTGEEERAVLAALAGTKRPDRERALVPDEGFRLLFILILHTGLRLREAYRLRVDQVDLRRRVILVEGSKGHRGAIKPRHVPIVPALQPELEAWCRGRVGLLFGFWSGDASPAELARTTGRLSVRFRTLFDYAGVADITEHDLRHEATCRWVELRRPDGAWAFSDIEVCRIMGWTDTRMMLRYASLRGEDLAARIGG